MTSINEWGPAAWYLFHALANNAKYEYFSDIKDDILDFFFSLCNNLPCDECRGHATSLIRSLDKKSIKTQRDLKLMLMEFHNLVNKRNNKHVFTEEELNKKYDKANLVNIIEYFFTVWNTKNSNSKLMSNSFHRVRFLKKLNDWLTNNFYKFEP